MKDRKNKFMFDLHIFDEENIVEEAVEENLPPPPPVFSEAELAAARTKSFEEGRAQGLAEGRQRTEEKIALLLDKIAADAQGLFEAERAREKRFEAEAVRLTLAVFEKLFPFYRERHGFEELKEALVRILAHHTGQAKILVEAAPDQRDALEEHLSRIAGQGVEPLQFQVNAVPQIPSGSCRLSWADGGAVRDISAMAEEIRRILEEMLAGAGANRHDKGAVTNTGSGPPAPEDTVTDGDQP